MRNIFVWIKSLAGRMTVFGPLIILMRLLKLMTEMLSRLWYSLPSLTVRCRLLTPSLMRMGDESQWKETAIWSYSKKMFGPLFVHVQHDKVCLTELLNIAQLPVKNLSWTSSEAEWSAVGLIAWPAHSPNLNPLDFHFWALAERQVYATKPSPVDELIDVFKQYAAECREDVLKNVPLNVLKRARLC